MGKAIGPVEIRGEETSNGQMEAGTGGSATNPSHRTAPSLEEGLSSDFHKRLTNTTRVVIKSYPVN